MAPEKRKFSRIPFRMRCKVTMAEATYELDEMNNLGVGGCLLSIDATPDSGTPCELEILLTGSSSQLTVHVSGEVLRVGGRGVAVGFMRIDPDSLFHLQNIVRYNSNDPEQVESEIRKHPGLF